jgi:hypothetical protein
MKRLFWISICVVVAMIPVGVLAASGGEGTFDGVVNSIEGRYHVHATRIPFMALASMIANRATNGGVGGVRVAEFEHFSGPVDGDELNRMVEEKLGSGWERMIRDTSKHGQEQTLIFDRQDGRRMALFIVDKDGGEMDVVQVSVDPAHLQENLGQYSHHGKDSSSKDSSSGDSDKSIEIDGDKGDGASN